jgi:hypothetical protein
MAAIVILSIRVAVTVVVYVVMAHLVGIRIHVCILIVTIPASADFILVFVGVQVPAVAIQIRPVAVLIDPIVAPVNRPGMCVRVIVVTVIPATAIGDNSIRVGIGRNTSRAHGVQAGLVHGAGVFVIAGNSIREGFGNATVQDLAAIAPVAGVVQVAAIAVVSMDAGPFQTESRPAEDPLSARH